MLGTAYRPRPPDDLHATIIGLGRPVGPPDLPGLLDDLARAFTEAPMTVRFGGFRADDDRLPSRGRTLAERTLVLRERSVVLVGVPVDPEPVARLAEIRRRCEARGFRHKYHDDSGPLDPDAYLVLGDLVEPPPAGVVVAAEALTSPVLVPLGHQDLSLVEYADRTLSRATSRWWPLPPVSGRGPGSG